MADGDMIAHLASLSLAATKIKQCAASMIEPELDGEYKYEAGGVLAANGKIYFAPSNAPTYFAST